MFKFIFVDENGHIYPVELTKEQYEFFRWMDGHGWISEYFTCYDLDELGFERV